MDVTITVTDGQPLAGQVLEPEGPAQFTLIIAPGIGASQRTYRHLAAWMAARGVRVVTFDYRGMGASQGSPNAVATASLSTWAKQDGPGVIRFVEQSFGGPIVWLAHSFGGQAMALADDYQRLSAALLVAVQLGQPRHWSGLERLKIEAYWRLLLPTAAALTRRVPKAIGMGSRLPSGVAAEWARWGRADDWLFSHAPDAAARCAGFTTPMMAVGVSDDGMAPPASIDDLVSRFTRARIERLALTPEDLGATQVGHLGMLRPGAGERLWPQLLAFARREASLQRMASVA